MACCGQQLTWSCDGLFAGNWAKPVSVWDIENRGKSPNLEETQKQREQARKVCGHFPKWPGNDWC